MIQAFRQGSVAHLVVVVTAALLAAGTPAAWAVPAALARPATLEVESEPAGAAAYVDGKLVGATPLAVAGIAAGDHTVRLVKEGFLENSQLVSVPASGALLHVELTPTGNPLVRPKPRVERDSKKKWRLVGAGVAAGGLAFLGYKVLTRNEAPTVSGVTVDPPTALQGATAVACSASVTDADGDALSYTWSFGDGSTATGASTSHVYDSAGEYVVTVEVSDGKKKATGTTSVTVKSMAGRWTGRLAGDASMTFNLAQSGTAISGSYEAVYPGNRPVAGTVTGSVTPPGTATMTVRVPNFHALYFEAPLDASMDSMSGTVKENDMPYPFALARQ